MTKDIVNIDSMEGLPVKLMQEQLRKNPFKKRTDAVYDILEDAIISCRIRPGTRLNEKMISDTLGISRSPVREALQRLAASGLVVSGANERGYHVFHFTLHELKDLFQARRAIEGEIAYLCAQNRRNLDLKKLEQLAEDFSNCLDDDPQTLSGLDLEFHRLLCEASSSVMLKELYEHIDQKMTYCSIRCIECVREYIDEPDLRAITMQHLTILRAIELGIPEIAARAMREHIDACCNFGCRYHHSWLASSAE